jgi:hypothetical protein
LLGISTLRENLVAPVWMIFETWPTLVVEVVDEADDSPEGFGIGRSIALFPGAGTHAGFDGEGMLAQALGLGELS